MIKRLMLRPELVAVVLAVAVVLLAAQNLLRSDVAIAATGDIAKEDRTAAGGWTTQTLVATDGWVLTADASAADGWVMAAAEHGYALFRSVADTAVAKADPSTTTTTLTNWGTSMAALGAGMPVGLDGFGTIRLIWRAASNGAQTGTITCEIYDYTDAAVMVTQNFASNTTLTTRTNTASIDETGVHFLGARCSDSTGTDDPFVTYVGFEVY